VKRICVFGMGGIGGYMTARLVAAKSAESNDGLFITCIARGESLKVIQEKGLSFCKPDGQCDTFKPDLVIDDPKSLPEQDLVVLCVKGYDLAAACSAISHLVTPTTVILPLLNGIDIYERIRAVVNSGIIIPSCIYISAFKKEPGCIVYSGGEGKIVGGHDPNHKEFDSAPLLSLMKAADIPFDWQDDPFPALWKKYLFIASYALVTGMSGKSFGGVLESPELSASVQTIMKEIHSIAAAKGTVLPESVIMTSFETVRPLPYEATTSFARDVQVPGKPNESDLFGATILRLGQEVGVPTPEAKAAHEAIQKK